MQKTANTFLISSIEAQGRIWRASSHYFDRTRNKSNEEKKLFFQKA
jgi:predicted NAD-dependent protein-ADP-ribosyltransferase YbiA (DUF1768 family)